VSDWSTEALVDAAVNLLSAFLPAALDDVYAANADRDQAVNRQIDYTAPRPGLAETGGDYYADAASTILRYPAVEVSIPDLQMASFSLGQIEADVTENLVVVLWETGTRAGHLPRKLRRLAAAAYNVLLVEGAIAGAKVESVRAAWRWNPEAGERDEVTSGALLVLSLASTRARP
jgi:hypothetical protein